jgi:kynurenine formamidase
MPNWKVRPAGSNWGDFGPDDQYGRMNALTPAMRIQALREVQAGQTFCLSLPLDKPGGNVINSRRFPPAFHPVMRDGHLAFNLPLERISPHLTDVSTDEAILLYTHYSTHWDAFAHRGSLFDAFGEGNAEPVFYNGFRIADPDEPVESARQRGAAAVDISKMAETCVQGRGVLVDLHRHFGDDPVNVGFDMLAGVMEADGAVVEPGDILCLHSGFAQRLLDAKGRPDTSLRDSCPALDGHDPDLLRWIADSGVAAIAADNLAVERPSADRHQSDPCGRGSDLPVHELCLFKLGIHLGELWYLTELAEWLREHRRSRFLLTAPPIRLPGASAAPTTPVATV